MSGWAAAIGGIGGTLLSQEEKRKDRSFQGDIFDKNQASQKEYATHGIRWKVADAKAAGIHPLAALGANTISYTPQSVGTGSSSNYAAHGQNIARALSSIASSDEKKLKDLQNQIAAETLKKMKLENVGLAKTVANTNSVNDKGIITGQSTGVNYVPNEIPMMKSHGVSAGDMPLNTYATDDRGRKYVMVNDKATQMISDESPMIDRIGYTLNRIRDHVSNFRATFNPNKPASKEALRFLRKERPPADHAGMEYRYNLWTRSWNPTKKRSGHSQLFDHYSLYNLK